MSEALQSFIDFFGLDVFFDGTVLTVQEVIGLQLTATAGIIFVLVGVRCIFELIKTVTDWRNIR